MSLIILSTGALNHSLVPSSGMTFFDSEDVTTKAPSTGTEKRARNMISPISLCFRRCHNKNAHKY